MDGTLFTEPPGIVILVFFVLLLLASIILTIFCKRVNHGEKRNQYALLENQYVSLDTKRNTVQPPSDSRIKVRLVPSIPPGPDKKRVLKYSEDFENDEVKVSDEKSLRKESAVSTYKERFYGLLNKSQNNNNNNNAVQRRHSDIIVQLDSARNNSKVNIRPRLRRPDSVYEDGHGRVTFTLSYSSVDEFLTVLLIGARQMYSNDLSYEIRLPAISIQIEGLPETEVTSNPDEAPNPEYDQEFTFSLREFELYETTLRFTVWDIVTNNESRVIGFFRVNLTNFQKTLLDNADSGPICRDIKASLAEVSIAEMRRRVKQRS